MTESPQATISKPMASNQKSAYVSPTLTKHGEVSELTGTGGSFSGKRTRRRRRRRRRC